MKTTTPKMALVAAMAGGLALVFGLTGCHSIGPGSVPRDRSDYSTSVGDSWKRQTLLNIVKLRYLDPPIFVDVGQIVAGYSLQTGVSARGTLSSGNAVQGNFVTARSQGVMRFVILEPELVAVVHAECPRKLGRAPDDFFCFHNCAWRLSAESRTLHFPRFAALCQGAATINQWPPAAGLTSPAVAGACFEPPSFSTT